MPRRRLLFGAGGRLGKALHSRFSAVGDVVASIPWSEARRWLDQTDDAIRRRLAEAAGDGGFDVIFANGNTDPAQSIEQLMADNLTFVVRIVEAVRPIHGTRFITFGTMLETFDAIIAHNRYAQSKSALGRWVESAARDGLAGRIGHLRLHTLYGGGDPTPHMFMGQMLAALRARRRFPMSDGRQLREYHHVEDVAGAVERWLDRPLIEPAALTLSSGRALRLADLAQAVFERIGRRTDLDVGAIAAPPAENLDRAFPPSPDWLLLPSRDPLEGVAEWMTERLDA